MILPCGLISLKENKGRKNWRLRLLRWGVLLLLRGKWQLSFSERLMWSGRGVCKKVRGKGRRSREEWVPACSSEGWRAERGGRGGGGGGVTWELRRLESLYWCSLEEAAAAVSLYVCVVRIRRGSACACRKGAEPSTDRRQGNSVSLAAVCSRPWMCASVFVSTVPTCWAWCRARGHWGTGCFLHRAEPGAPAGLVLCRQAGPPRSCSCLCPVPLHRLSASTTRSTTNSSNACPRMKFSWKVQCSLFWAYSKNYIYILCLYLFFAIQWVKLMFSNVKNGINLFIVKKYYNLNPANKYV